MSRSTRSVSRPLEGAYPYLWLDAKHVKVRDHGRVVSKALVVAYAVHETGVREVIGLDIGEVESGAFWVEFLRSLKKRGLDGVRLAVSDQHEGLKTAIARVLACPWQRCTVHFVRDMVSTAAATSAASSPPRCGRCSTPRTAPTPASGSATSWSASAVSRRRSVELLEEAEEDLIAFYAAARQSTGPSCGPPTRWSGQQGDRPPLRRRRDLPQRRRP